MEMEVLADWFDHVMEFHKDCVITWYLIYQFARESHILDYVVRNKYYIREYLLDYYKYNIETRTYVVCE